MFYAPEHYRQDQRSLQALTSLLTLVEALATITEQEDQASRDGEKQPSLTLASAGKAFAEIVQQVLDCRYVAVLAIDAPDNRQRLLGVSGLNPADEALLLRDVDQVLLTDYINATTVDELQRDQVAELDLDRQPFLTTRSTHGARYRLLAPMIRRGQLIGFFTIARAEKKSRDKESAYTPQEKALARGVARLATQIIERVSLIQEREEAEAKTQQLEEETRRYEDCLSTASHELRTPLTTIKGNLQLSQRRITNLAKRNSESPAFLDGLQRIEQPLKDALQNFNRLERMISELLDYSRIQAQKFLLRAQPANLVEIVRVAIEDARASLDEREIQLDLPAQEEIMVNVDKDRICEVIHNYLTNAHKYSPLEFPVRVSLTLSDRQARVSVQDQGQGIKAEEQKRVWERFYRVPGITVVEQSIADSNLGLGLYLCKEIIDLHHRQVGVESAPGHGSTFWFTLTIIDTMGN